ncbi:MAG: PilZ domain-containing protein [Deltaproteobacteria bacterium]|nr:MAG: PilZ domain-containing protein [Deltaproteobacteria bacterium]
MPGKDKRRHSRVKPRGVVAHVRSGDRSFACQVENLSAGGLFLRTDQLFPRGTRVEVDRRCARKRPSPRRRTSSASTRHRPISRRFRIRAGRLPAHRRLRRRSQAAGASRRKRSSATSPKRSTWTTRSSRTGRLRETARPCRESPPLPFRRRGRFRPSPVRRPRRDHTPPRRRKSRTHRTTPRPKLRGSCCRFAVSSSSSARPRRGCAAGRRRSRTCAPSSTTCVSSSRSWIRAAEPETAGRSHAPACGLRP